MKRYYPFIIFTFGLLLWIGSTFLVTVYNRAAHTDNLFSKAMDAAEQAENYFRVYDTLLGSFYALYSSSDRITKAEMDRYYESWQANHKHDFNPDTVDFYGWYRPDGGGYYTRLSAPPGLGIVFGAQQEGTDPRLPFAFSGAASDGRIVITRDFDGAGRRDSAGKIFLVLNKENARAALEQIITEKYPRLVLHFAWGGLQDDDAQHALYSTVLDFHGAQAQMHFLPRHEWSMVRDNFLGLATGLCGFVLTVLLYLYSRHLSVRSHVSRRAQEEAEQQLADQLSFFENLLENLPGILFIKDVRKDYRYHMFNREAEAFFGRSRHEMLGKTDRDFFAEDQADFFRAIDEATMRGRKVIDIPCEVVTTKNGEMFCHTRKLPIYGSDGEPMFLVGLSEDITRRKMNEMELANYRQNLENMVDERTEKLRHAISKAEEANRLKSEFLATMSHEIRSPMSGVLGMAELLLDTPLTLEQKGLTRTILNSGEVLMNIIEDILDFSKIEANKLELDPVAVNMLDLVDDVCMLYSNKAREKAIELAVRYAPGTEQFVYADPLRLRQVIGNLLNNAVKFTHKGSIVLTVEEDRSGDLPEDKVMLRFCVQDTGIGIAKKDQERIFEKFSQANSSTTRDYGGTGLGLSICRKLVEMMGGELNVLSEPGEGSQFYFTLPLTRNREESFVHPSPPLLHGRRILIVDDLSVIRQMLCEQLTLAGMICDTAASGHEALQKAVEARDEGVLYDMMIIDYLMPGMNGEMLARALSDDPALRGICLVMLTAAGNPIMGDDFAEKGFSAYIAKPVRAIALIDTLAIIWEKYSGGQTDTLIRVDTGAFSSLHADADDIRLEGAKILLVEDSRLNQAFVEEVLLQLACDTTTVSNGLEAVEIVKKQPFDLVLMDCQMPVMDGFEATRQICGLKQQGAIAQNLPILALTANAMKGDRQRCLEAGMNDYITKPVRKNELKEKIHSWITRGGEERKPAGASVGRSDREAGGEILNHALLLEARTLLKDKFDFLLGCYIEDVENYIREIQNAVASRNLEGVVRPAHTIKSTSKRMGALSLSDIARDIELTAREAANGNEENFWNTQGLSEELRRMSTVFEETRRLLIASKDAA